jgi:hypothetical protein
MNKAIAFALLPVAALALSACTMSPSAAEYDKATADIIKNSFQDRGIAKVDRLVQDDANRECAAADVAGKTIDPTVAKAIEAANMKTVKWPTLNQASRSRRVAPARSRTASSHRPHVTTPRASNPQSPHWSANCLSNGEASCLTRRYVNSSEATSRLSPDHTVSLVRWSFSSASN